MTQLKSKIKNHLYCLHNVQDFRKTFRAEKPCAFWAKNRRKFKPVGLDFSPLYLGHGATAAIARSALDSDAHQASHFNRCISIVVCRKGGAMSKFLPTPGNFCNSGPRCRHVTSNLLVHVRPLPGE